MSSDRLMFAGVFGLAMAACAAPSAHPEELSQEKLGKAASAETFNCECAGMPGTWSGNYSSAQSAASDLDVYCRYGGSCTNASGGSSSGGSSPSTSSPGYNPGGGGSGTGTGTGDPFSNPFGNTGSTGGGSVSPPNSSNIARDGEFRNTSEYWNWFHTYHDERSEAGFNDGDAVRFFDGIKEAKNYQNISAFSSILPLKYAASVVIFALGKLSDAQVDAIAAKYQATGRQQGIRVVLDVSTDMYTGATWNYLIYNISDGALLGQTSFIFPSFAQNNGNCEYGTYGDVSVAVQNCTSGHITGCNSGYNCM